MKPQAAPARMPATTAKGIGMSKLEQLRDDRRGEGQRGGLAEIENAAADADERLRDREDADDRHGEGDREHRLVRQEVGAIERPIAMIRAIHAPSNGHCVAPAGGKVRAERLAAGWSSRRAWSVATSVMAGGLFAYFFGQKSSKAVVPGRRGEERCDAALGVRARRQLRRP